MGAGCHTIQRVVTRSRRQVFWRAIHHGKRRPSKRWGVCAADQDKQNRYQYTVNTTRATRGSDVSSMHSSTVAAAALAAASDALVTRASTSLRRLTAAGCVCAAARHGAANAVTASCVHSSHSPRAAHSGPARGALQQRATRHAHPVAMHDCSLRAAALRLCAGRRSELTARKETSAQSIRSALSDLQLFNCSTGTSCQQRSTAASGGVQRCVACTRWRAPGCGYGSCHITVDALLA